MICKLTGKEGTPAKAHIIPESFYLFDKELNEPSLLVTNSKGIYSKRTWKGIYDDSIVTQEGERYFLKCDDYAFKLLVEQFASAKPLELKGSIVAYIYDNFDYDKLKLFFLSVLWRAAVSSHPFFKRVDIGSHLETIRKAIIESDPGSSHFYSTVLALFDASDERNWAKIMDPFKGRIADITFYTFYLGNIVAYIKVDKRKARTPMREIQIDPNRPLYLIKKNFWDSNEVSIMRNIVRKLNG